MTKENNVVYDEGFIYKIECNITKKVYYGSTKDFVSRISVHKSQCKLFENTNKSYISSYEVLKSNDYKASIVDVYYSIPKIELCAIEGIYIRENECVNKYNPGTAKDIVEKKNLKALEPPKDKKPITPDTMEVICDLCKCGVQTKHYMRHLQSAKHKAELDKIEQEKKLKEEAARTKKAKKKGKRWY